MLDKDNYYIDVKSWPISYQMIEEYIIIFYLNMVFLLFKHH